MVTHSQHTVEAPRSRTAPIAAWVAVAVYCWIAGSFSSFSWKSSVAVLIPGSVVYIIGVTRHPSNRPRSHPISPLGAVTWWAPWLSFCTLEVIDDLLGSTYQHPTLSILADSLFDEHFWRAAGYFAWIVVGWKLVKR